MSLYFSNEKQSFYSSEINSSDSLPEDAVAISSEVHDQLLLALNSENVVVLEGDGGITIRPSPVTTLKARAWRDYELRRADIELYKIQDGDPKAKGSVGDWRSYRKQLRAWPETATFPSDADKPVAPDYSGV